MIQKERGKLNGEIVRLHLRRKRHGVPPTDTLKKWLGGGFPSPQAPLPLPPLANDEQRVFSIPKVSLPSVGSPYSRSVGPLPPSPSHRTGDKHPPVLGPPPFGRGNHADGIVSVRGVRSLCSRNTSPLDHTVRVASGAR